MSKIAIAVPNEDDIPTLARLAGDSFLDDRHTQMKSHAKNSNPYDHEQVMDGMLRSQLKSPRAAVFKAVDVDSGEIVGWICWGFRGFDEGQIQHIKDNVGSIQYKRPANETQTPSSNEVVVHRSAPSSIYTKEAGQDPIEALEAATNADMNDWIKTLMPDDSKCIFVQTLCVAPRWQSKGVGSSLLGTGIVNADQHGAMMWVHASEGSWPMYSKNGFNTVGKLEVDLDYYAIGSPTTGSNPDWGHYTFRYMKRNCCGR